MNTRLMAIRLIKIDTLMVKEPLLPIAFKINITEQLTEAQLSRLVLASPWMPMAIEVQLGDWNNTKGSFDATISSIESLPKTPAVKHKKTLRWGQVKRKRGYMSHD